MANKFGVFFPMFQREGIWISFDAAENAEYHVRVFVGGINMVSGGKMGYSIRPYNEVSTKLRYSPSSKVYGWKCGRRRGSSPICRHAHRCGLLD
ncbi:hypothetical protein P154DRAFT_610581 [Amniculicola lignicola CBS 123094]|uniref:Uncharacterized protein n=1 Tax=Amniculicola lignicola CBS 123094 TaxID=1392246 RepID=A0A6A5W3T5_9PLEO|nr:hypothetical protein P154DRAFT_610581 [Amniculicola lignicola CBS 123094]